jgi:hypothetical protein
MNKKEIYEHLAKIYLDASLQKKNKERRFPALFKSLPLVVSFFFLLIAVTVFINFQRGKSFRSETALVLLTDSAKINFHFDPARKETYALNLNKLNLARYRSLEFSVKKVDYFGNISLRVEFCNLYNEKSELYFKDIPSKWRTFKVGLSQFKSISDWTEMGTLTFAIEEWNARQKKGVVYLDNVRLLR